MLRRVDFWTEEREAPLLRLNCSFLPCEEILQRILDDYKDDLAVDFDHVRIIRVDAERTFLGSAQRLTLMNVLSSLRHEFNSYHQAMSYVAGFLLLTHSPFKVMDLMRQLHRHVLVGYWAEEPVAFAIDAYVFDFLLADHDREVHEHLTKNYILPETYVQKWFTTLCVGVLPFKALFHFFDTYVVQSLAISSSAFLFQFALSLMKHIREGILNTKNAAVIYGYLRLDSSLPLFNGKYNELVMSIVQCAKDYDLSQYDFAMLRQKAFDQKLRTRLEAAKRVHSEGKESHNSSATSSDDEVDLEEKKLVSKMETLVSHMEHLRIE